MKTIDGKKAAGYSLAGLAFAVLAIPLSANATPQTYPRYAHEYYAYYRHQPTVGPVISRGDVNIRDPYHLPESYNYDWPYGLGLSH